MLFSFVRYNDIGINKKETAYDSLSWKSKSGDYYSEAYLDEVAEYEPEIDVSCFIRDYMMSKTREYMDKGQF